MSKAFKKTYTTDPVINKLQENIEEVVSPFVKNLLLDGFILSNIALVTGQDNVINHKLGRKLQGWILIGNDSNAVVYDNQSNNTLPNSTLLLKASANCIIKLYVF